jgi:hypothetical protein
MRLHPLALHTLARAHPETDKSAMTAMVVIDDNLSSRCFTYHGVIGRLGTTSCHGSYSPAALGSQGQNITRPWCGRRMTARLGTNGYHRIVIDAGQEGGGTRWRRR